MTTPNQTARTPEPTPLGMELLLNRCLTRNCRRLVRLLHGRGVEFEGDGTLFIRRNLGQGMMNRAGGTDAPTWELRTDAPANYDDHILYPGRGPALTFDGSRYLGLQSHMPLTWILRQPVEEWEIAPHEFTGGLLVTVKTLPPHWQ